MNDNEQAEPLRETIVIARGPNVHGHEHQVVAAQADDETKRELASRAAEDEALQRAAASVRRIDGKPDVLGDDGLIHGDPSSISGVPLRGIEDGEGNEEGISTDVSTPAEER